MIELLIGFSTKTRFNLLLHKSFEAVTKETASILSISRHAGCNNINLVKFVICNT